MPTWVKNTWALSTIRADRAWAQLELEHGIGTEPGSGQTVGVIDTGIDTGHPLFAGKTVTEEFMSGATDEDGSKRSHGTAVSSAIVGRSLDDDFTAEVTAPRGVAWGADIAMFAIPAGSGSGNYVPVSLTGLDNADTEWKSWIERVLNWRSGGRRLDFVNLSVGHHGIIEQYSQQELRTNLGDAIAKLAQAGASEKTVFVWAAGNAHGDPCDPERLPGRLESLRQQPRQRQVGRGHAGPARAHLRAARERDRRRGNQSGRRHRRLLQSLRHRRPMVHCGPGQVGAAGLLRA